VLFYHEVSLLNECVKIGHIVVMAQDKAASPDQTERARAMRLGRLSYVLSAFGMIIGLTVYAVVFTNLAIDDQK